MEKITKKPVVFYDLETTGKDNDTNNVRIIELAAIKYEDTENWKEIGRIETRFNNGDVEIQPGAIAVHGIEHNDVKDLPTFHARAKEIYDFFDGCDVGGYNNSFFDNSVLFHSFLRAGLKWDYRKLDVYDILELYRKYHSAKLTHVYEMYIGKPLEDAHFATADIEATIAVYKKMKERGEDFEGDELKFYKDNIDLIGDFKMRDTESGEREPYYNFGENKGRSIEEVGPGMLEWMIYKKPHNYPADTIHAAEKLLEWLNKKADKKFMERKEQENKSGKHWYD